MRHRIFAVLGLTLVLFSSACYHATITTGLPAGTEKVSKEWAHGFLLGLIAPSTVETASTCKNGAAIVETQHSFLNMLAQFITFSLYTPMQIDVTCASSNRMSLGPSAPGDEIRAKDGSPEALRTAIAEAAEASAQRHHPVLVRF
jgi:hypothetical protein